jgi:radical SAM superfamily enzyme
VAIHRITGDGPKGLLIAPLWSGHKKAVLNELHHYLKEHQVVQGSAVMNEESELR